MRTKGTQMTKGAEGDIGSAGFIPSHGGYQQLLSYQNSDCLSGHEPLTFGPFFPFVLYIQPLSHL